MYSKELIEKVIKEFQPKSKEPLTNADAEEILYNLSALFKYLNELYFKYKDKLQVNKTSQQVPAISAAVPRRKRKGKQENSKDISRVMQGETKEKASGNQEDMLRNYSRKA